MQTFKTFRTQFLRQCGAFAADERATTAIEYGIIAAGIGAFVAATVYSLGSTVESTFYNKLLNVF
jgi:Flp pilus assembly pilin Flp